MQREKARQFERQKVTKNPLLVAGSLNVDGYCMGVVDAGGCIAENPYCIVLMF